MSGKIYGDPKALHITYEEETEDKRGQWDLMYGETVIKSSYHDNILENYLILLATFNSMMFGEDNGIFKALIVDILVKWENLKN